MEFGLRTLFRERCAYRGTLDFLEAAARSMGEARAVPFARRAKC